MSATSGNRLIVVEVGGSGGVFQHALAVAIALASAGVQVELKTSECPEITDRRVEITKCFDWKRTVKLGRSIQILASFFFRTLPVLLRGRETMWVQGTFKPPLTFVMILLLRIRSRKRRLVYSPHNLFSRRGGKYMQFLQEACLHLASEVVVYNTGDFRQLRQQKISVHLAPLLMYTPIVDVETAERWRNIIENLGITVCSVGQLRPDKNLPMLLDAAREASTPLLIMGADAGVGDELREHVASNPSNTCALFEGYYPLADMAAVVALVGTVALPYSVASQSAVSVLAKAYGATVVAYAVGGLRDQADVLVESLDAKDWANALSMHVRTNGERRVPIPKGPSEGELAALMHAAGFSKGEENE